MAQALYLNLVLVLWRGMEMIWGQNRGNKVFTALSFDIIQGFFPHCWCRKGLVTLKLLPLHEFDKWGRGRMITPQIIPERDGEKTWAPGTMASCKCKCLVLSGALACAREGKTKQQQQQKNNPSGRIFIRLTQICLQTTSCGSRAPAAVFTR